MHLNGSAPSTIHVSRHFGSKPTSQTRKSLFRLTLDADHTRLCAFQLSKSGLAQRAHQRTTLRLTQPAEAKRFTGQLLMLKQCLVASVHGAQRSQIRRCDMELLTELSPRRLRA